MRLLRINKKGESIEQGYSPLHLLAAGIIFIIMAFFLLYIINQYVGAYLVQDESIPGTIYAYRAINVCLAYTDQVTGRVYPGIIDVKKYNQATLDSCYSNTAKSSFNFQLKDKDRDYAYDRILVGFGASLSTKSYPVFIRNADGSTAKGELVFGMSSKHVNTDLNDS